MKKYGRNLGIILKLISWVLFLVNVNAHLVRVYECCLWQPSWFCNLGVALWFWISFFILHKILKKLKCVFHSYKYLNVWIHSSEISKCQVIWNLEMSSHYHVTIRTWYVDTHSYCYVRSDLSNSTPNQNITHLHFVRTKNIF